MGAWLSSESTETILCRQNTRNIIDDPSNELDGYDIEAQTQKHTPTCTTKNNSTTDPDSLHNTSITQDNLIPLPFNSLERQFETNKPCNCHELTSHHTAQEIASSFEDLQRENHIGSDVTSPQCIPIIHVWQTGPLSCNTIVIADPETKKGMLIDPGGDTFVEQGLGHKKRLKNVFVVDRIKELEIDIIYIVITHAHFDHVLGLGSIRSGFPDARVYLHRREKIPWQFIPFQLSMIRIRVDPEVLSSIGVPDVHFTPRMPPGLELPGETPEIERIKDWSENKKNQLLAGDVNEIIDFLDCIILHTPGHSEGSICLYFPSARLLLSGDTLFKDAVGRSDLNGGNEGDLRRSILKKLYTLPNNTNVIPGHGPRTMIGREKGSNPVVKHGDPIPI